MTIVTLVMNNLMKKLQNNCRWRSRDLYSSQLRTRAVEAWKV